MKQFLDDHFNTLLVTGLIGLFVWLTLHIIHDGRDVGAIQWVENMTGQFVSALFTLIVARKVFTPGTGGTIPSIPSISNTPNTPLPPSPSTVVNQTTEAK